MSELIMKLAELDRCVSYYFILRGPLSYDTYFFWYSLPFSLNCSFFSKVKFFNHFFLYSSRFLFRSGDNELYLSHAFCFISSLFLL